MLTNRSCVCTWSCFDLWCGLSELGNMLVQERGASYPELFLTMAGVRTGGTVYCLYRTAEQGTGGHLGFLCGPATWT